MKNFVIILAVLTLVRCDWLEVREKTFSDYESAMKSGIVGDGKWISKTLLPLSAKDIKIKYDIDSNEIWLSFEFDSVESLNIQNICPNVSYRKIILPRSDRTNVISWWPKTLIGSIQKNRHNEMYIYYNCMNIYGGMIAVDISEKRVYYWSLGS